MQTISPVQPISNQILKVVLGGQACQINIRQTLYGVFLDLRVADNLIVAGAPCLDRNRIVRSTYLGFIGDLMFVDTQGTDDPSENGLGTRFQLVYLEASEVIDP